MQSPAVLVLALIPARTGLFVKASAVAWVALSAAVLSGCVDLTPNNGGGVSGLHAPVSATSTPAGAGVAALSRWWQQFNDPALERLVEEALQANTSIVRARAVLAQSRALRDAAEASLSPTLGLGASVQRNDTRSNGGINNLAVNADAGWVPDVFGRGHAGVRAAEAIEQASVATLADVRVNIASEVSLNYIALRGTQQRLVIAQLNLASQAETLQIAQWRQQAGLITALEVAQALAATQQTRAFLPALQTSLDQSRHALAVLTGQAPTQLDTPLAAVADIPRPPASLALKIPADTLRQRADVRAAEWRIESARALVAQADAARWPSFNLGGSLGLSALSLGALTQGASVVSSLLASVSLPVFDGGARRAQVRVQSAGLDLAQQDYRATVLAALLQVEDALIALRNDQSRLLNLQAAASAATEAATLARQRFASGLIDFQVVLETQRTQLSAQDSLASARTDVSADHVRLVRALGGGWQADDLTLAQP